MIVTTEGFWVVAGSTIAMTIALWLIIAARKSARSGVMYHVKRQFRDVEIITSSDRVEFCGLDRSWDGLWRGEGVLLLTDDSLYFRLMDRDMDLRVPISRIEQVVTADNGEDWQGRGQIQVAYRAFDDQLRTATWKLKDPRKWKELIATSTGRIS